MFHFYLFSVYTKKKPAHDPCYKAQTGLWLWRNKYLERSDTPPANNLIYSGLGMYSRGLLLVSYCLCFFGGEFCGSGDGIDRKAVAVRRCCILIGVSGAKLLLLCETCKFFPVFLRNFF